MKKFLLLLTLIAIHTHNWCAQLTKQVPADEQKKTAAAVPVQTVIPRDLFEQIKQTVAREERDGTLPKIFNCSDAALYLIKATTNISLRNDLVTQLLDLPPEKFNYHASDYEYGTLDAQDRNVSKTSFFKKFFTRKGVAEHQAYFIFIGGATRKLQGNYHTFMLEKFYGGASTPWWKVYHSWNNTFTLQEWLGTACATHRDESTKNAINASGKGQKLNLQKIVNSLFALIQEIATKEPNNGSLACYYLHQFDIPLQIATPQTVRHQAPTSALKRKAEDHEHDREEINTTAEALIATTAAQAEPLIKQ